nr:sigma-70 family RNA polymerase sigma factor [uncultured Acetatifactor sp.]
MEDSQIIELYWQRQESAIRETETKYGAFCLGIAANILSAREDAEECVNDTYFHAWKSMPPQRPEKLRAWLGRVVRNIAINLWHRNRALKRYAGIQELLSELEDCIPSPQTIEQEMEGKELAEYLDSWLLSLSAVDRRLFVRRYWNGIPLGQLAREQGIPCAKLAQQMYRLRQNLKLAEVGDGFVTYRSGITVSEEGVTIPPMEVILGRSNDELCMLAFFIYQGHCYVEYERLENDSSKIVGEYLGTATGLIDEWTPRDGYVELAGSVEGDFYSVKGYEPSFLLCMQKEGTVSLYVREGGITLKTGADLYNKWLHLSEDYREVRYETRASWYYGSGEVRQLDAPRAQEVLDFIQALDEAEFLPVEEIEARSGISPFAERRL